MSIRQNAVQDEGTSLTLGDGKLMVSKDAIEKDKLSLLSFITTCILSLNIQVNCTIALMKTCSPQRNGCLPVAISFQGEYEIVDCSPYLRTAVTVGLAYFSHLLFIFIFVSFAVDTPDIFYPKTSP